MSAMCRCPRDSLGERRRLVPAWQRYALAGGVRESAMQCLPARAWREQSGRGASVESEDSVNPVEMLQSLKSSSCPACGGGKGARKSFCYRCFGLLPWVMKGDLYKRFGDGYEDAFDYALKWIKERLADAGVQNG